MKIRKQITIAKKGNTCMGFYINSGLSDYYSVWIIKFTVENGYADNFKANIKSFNNLKQDIPQKYFDNTEKMHNEYGCYC